jgi:hypothetical protein
MNNKTISLKPQGWRLLFDLQPSRCQMKNDSENE